MWITNDDDKDSLKTTINSNGKQQVGLISIPLYPCILTTTIANTLAYNNHTYTYITYIQGE